MARKFSLLTTKLLKETNKAYAKLKEDKIAKKLLAIIACSEHSAQEIGKILKVSRDLSIILHLKKSNNTSML